MNPEIYAPRLEPVPHPECNICSAASKRRAESHMAGRPGDIARATEIIRQHSTGHRDAL
jgi:hypothetical protein